MFRCRASACLPSSGPSCRASRGSRCRGPFRHHQAVVDGLGAEAGAGQQGEGKAGSNPSKACFSPFEVDEVCGSGARLVPHEPQRTPASRKLLLCRGMRHEPRLPPSRGEPSRRFRPKRERRRNHAPRLTPNGGTLPSAFVDRGPAGSRLALAPECGQLYSALEPGGSHERRSGRSAGKPDPRPGRDHVRRHAAAPGRRAFGAGRPRSSARRRAAVARSWASPGSCPSSARSSAGSWRVRVSRPVASAARSASRSLAFVLLPAAGFAAIRVGGLNPQGFGAFGLFVALSLVGARGRPACLAGARPRAGAVRARGTAAGAGRDAGRDARRLGHALRRRGARPSADGPLVKWLVIGVVPQLTIWIWCTVAVGAIFGVAAAAVAARRPAAA